LSYVCFLEIQLRLPGNGSLKGKRKEITSLKAQLRQRFGASVAETDHHDLWQRATLSAALVGHKAGSVDEQAARIERFVVARFPDGVRIERAILRGDEVLG
jgi:uncharacterized protein YlxP (DUF503 family)